MPTSPHSPAPPAPGDPVKSARVVSGGGPVDYRWDPQHSPWNRADRYLVAIRAYAKAYETHAAQPTTVSLFALMDARQRLLDLANGAEP